MTGRVDIAVHIIEKIEKKVKLEVTKPKKHNFEHFSDNFTKKTFCRSCDFFYNFFAFFLTNSSPYRYSVYMYND